MKNEPIKDHLSEISQTVSHMVSNPLRPLSAFRSIKMKIGILVLGAVFTTVFVYWLGLRFGRAWPSFSGIVAALVALVLTRFFAHGLTTPLREMSNISKEIAKGNYDVEVNVNTQDEIGSLALTFNKMAKELSKTEILRKELIANASHELRTPLNAIMNLTDAISKEIADEKLKQNCQVDGVEEPDLEKMQILLRQTEHLSALVKDLLDLSKLESGLTRLDLTNVSIYKLLTNLKQVTLQANSKLEIVVNHSQVKIEADYHRLIQVFTNIFSNSIKHAVDQCEIECTILENGNFVEILIDDNGQGISKDKQELVFERFYTIDSARNSKNGGFGIGLAITKQIINMHNGTISISNSQTGGTRIRIVLPKIQTKVVQPKMIVEQESSTQNSNINKFEEININPPKEKTKWNSIQSTM